MFVKINPHPQGKMVGDCVKRACCLASEINYHDIAIMLNRYRKESGGSKFNSNENWRQFVENVLLGKGNGNVQYANNGKRYSVEEYAYHHKNCAILRCAKHLVAINGCGYFMDTWDCGEKYVYKAFEKHIRKNFKSLCKGLSLERIDLCII